MRGLRVGCALCRWCGWCGCRDDQQPGYSRLKRAGGERDQVLRLFGWKHWGLPPITAPNHPEPRPHPIDRSTRSPRSGPPGSSQPDRQPPSQTFTSSRSRYGAEDARAAGGAQNPVRPFSWTQAARAPACQILHPALHRVASLPDLAGRDSARGLSNLLTASAS